MKITEVLDNTKFWAELKGINLEIFNSLIADYRVLRDLKDNSRVLKAMGLSAAYKQSQSTIEDLSSKFIKDLQSHISDLRDIDIQDPDISDQMAQLEQLAIELNK